MNIDLTHIGKVLIVDDIFSQDIKELIHKLVETGFTVEYWNADGDQDSFISNVRILILDLDLSGGVVPKGDDAFYAMAVDVLHKIHGPYIVVFYAREFEQDDIDKIVEMYEKEYGQPIEGFVESITGHTKNIEAEKLIQLISETIKNKEIFQLILLWEKILDKAKDLGLSKFIRKKFENEINAFVKDLANEVGEQSLPREFISNMLRFVSRYSLSGIEFKMLSKLLEKIKNKSSESVSNQLLQNRNMYFRPDEKEQVWTGDIFKEKVTNVTENYFVYNLILTPECYIAQDKTNSFLVCKGFPLNFTSLSDKENHPIYKITKDFKLPKQGEMSTDEYQIKLKKCLNVLNRSYDRLFPLWNFSEEDDKYLGICFDFQNLNSISKTDFNKLDQKRISRLDFPYITELMQKYAGYSTRVGVPDMNLPHIDVDE